MLSLPAPQPVAIQNAATPDEASSDPPSEDERGGDVGEDQAIEDEPIAPLVLDSAVPEDMGMASSSAPDKRPLKDQERVQKNLKTAKTEPYPVKHGGERSEATGRAKHPRLEGRSTSAEASGSPAGLQAGPMNAANIRMVLNLAGLMSTLMMTRIIATSNNMLMTCLLEWIFRWKMMKMKSS